jgi:hypothetical protein
VGKGEQAMIFWVLAGMVIIYSVLDDILDELRAIRSLLEDDDEEEN